MSERADEVVTLMDESLAAVAALRDQAAVVADIADAVVRSLKAGHTLLLCGNGGSAAQCQHIATEFTGRFKLERPGFRAIALTTDSSALTAIGNDYGFERVFSRQVEAVARPGDVLVGLSTSGGSANVLKAFEAARTLGVTTVALVGSTPAKMAELADITLAAPSDTSAAIQECHLVALHIVCDLAERQLAK